MGVRSAFDSLAVIYEQLDELSLINNGGTELNHKFADDLLLNTIYILKGYIVQCAEEPFLKSKVTTIVTVVDQIANSYDDIKKWYA